MFICLGIYIIGNTEPSSLVPAQTLLVSSEEPKDFTEP